MTDGDRSMPRLDAITGLRWWAAFAVFFFHVRNLVPLPAGIAELANLGHLGVTFFFVLSGFVLTWSWRSEVDRRTFYWRRFARIYPLALVTLLLALPVFYSFSPDPAQPWVKPVDVVVLLLCVLLLQGWSRDPAVLFAGNPAAWTLTVEAFFYAVHPFIIVVLRRLAVAGALVVAAGSIAFAVGVRVAATLLPDWHIGELPWPLLRVNEFVLGMALAWARRKGWSPRLPVWVVATVFVAFFVGVVLLGARAGGTPIHGFVTTFINEIATILSAALIVAVTRSELRDGVRLLRARPIVALGEWSFAFYLIHATLIYLALDLVGRQSGGWVGLGWIALLLAASIAAAWALHRFVEAPAERAMRRWQNTRRSERQRSVASRSVAR